MGVGAKTAKGEFNHIRLAGQDSSLIRERLYHRAFGVPFLGQGAR